MKDSSKEQWQCPQGLTELKTDANGCPLDQRFCKTQGGGQAGTLAVPIATGAPWTITVALPNFVEARVRGLVLQAFDVAAGNADVLHTQTLSSIQIQANEMLGNGIVGAERYRSDATGAGFVGSGQSYNGRLGSTGGNMVIQGVNQSLVGVVVIATVDVTAVR